MCLNAAIKLFQDLLRETEREFEDMMETKKRKAEEIKALVNQCKVGVTFFKKFHHF